ncbi:MAG TPA: DinB family protein [Chthonomonas sp.]|uniref:DinB family protein n=1 Tax=Chthonomonas sp. TaxID=2282153 RepID=UPI002B4B7FDA|nr:DinB family protein [Chthonomonas sp.]HLI48027.1 DinB family protein [Chthonomonas sp.]
MRIQDYVAAHTRAIAESLAHFVRTTAPDKLNWRIQVSDTVTTRSVLDLIAECVAVNYSFASYLQGVPRDVETPVFQEAEPALQALLESADALAKAIESLSDADLEREYERRNVRIPGHRFILMGYRNMAYHAGQINFIQTLYGDTEFHVPPNWR